MLNAAAKYSRSTPRILRMDNLLFASVRPSCKSRKVSRPAGCPAPLSSDRGRSISTGIGDRFQPESVIGLDRNTHLDTPDATPGGESPAVAGTPR